MEKNHSGNKQEGWGGGIILEAAIMFDNKVVKCAENHIEAHNHYSSYSIVST